MPFADLDGINIHYRQHPSTVHDSESLVFLHDGLGAIGSWGKVPALLSDILAMPALVYDRHGYGLSSPRGNFPYRFMEAEVPRLIRLLDTMAIKRAHLIGHSDGASIALLCAGKHPARVLSVVSEAAHCWVEPETARGIENLVANGAAEGLPRWLTRLHGDRAEGLLRAWSSGWLSEDHGAWSIVAEMDAVKCPVLAIQGEDDDFGTLAQVSALRRQIPHALEWVLAGCGHTPHTEYQQDYIARIGRFIKSTMINRNAETRPSRGRDATQGKG